MIDQNFVLWNNIRMYKLAKPITVYNVDGMENKTGTITWYVDVNLRIGNREVFSLPHFFWLDSSWTGTRILIFFLADN